MKQMALTEFLGEILFSVALYSMFYPVIFLYYLLW